MMKRRGVGVQIGRGFRLCIAADGIVDSEDRIQAIESIAGCYDGEYTLVFTNREIILEHEHPAAVVLARLYWINNTQSGRAEIDRIEDRAESVETQHASRRHRTRFRTAS